MQFTRLSVHDEGPVCHITFNRPERANALDGQSWQELRAAMERLDRTRQLRVAVLHGAGRHFCSGIDHALLNELRPNGEFPGRAADRIRQRILEIQDCVTTIETVRKPVIAAIHGACIGGGLEVAAACDIRLCAQDTRFCLKEVDLGIVADVGALQRLPNLIGHGRARQLALTARTMQADEALRIGLVTEVCPDVGSLLSTAASWPTLWRRNRHWQFRARKK
ncbi:enoyl-CoA hydratase-related protein [Sulfitobacter porphyrae]|uniref:Enoyl-CoA hydratase-related protein n=1 Tax=Sulfitobacter porphyrae TaxID=1246864 RepID=A0ABW2B6V0_9RHOB